MDEMEIPGRRACRRVVVAALALVVAGRADAQLSTRMVRDDIDHTATSVYRVWTTPARLDRGDWTRVALGTAGVAVVAVTLDRPVDRWFAEHQSSLLVRAIKPFRDSVDAPGFVKIGNAPVILPLSAILYGAGIAATAVDRDDTGRALRDAGMGCAAVNFSNMIIRYAGYLLVSRERPGTAGGDPFKLGFRGKTWNRQSFNSGHVANTFGCVTFVTRRFDLGPAEPALYVIPVSVALGRLADRRHWTSDVTIGVLLGVGVGTFLANRSLDRARR